jgi:CRISPR system Cascade subunit CasB
MSQLLERLRQRKDDRAVMAGLRCTLVNSQKHRAWPVLHRLGVDVNNREAALVAALYATHPFESSGNLGDACRQIQRSRGDLGNDDNKLTSTERRFLHLLAAERGDELFQRVIRIVLLAKSQNVGIDYDRLEKDLRLWGDRTKADWAASFWTNDVDSPPDAEEGGDA